MAAVSVSIAEAVKAMLASAAISQAIAPERSYADWELALDGGDALHIDVVAVTTEQKIELSSRGTNRFLVPVDIAVRKRLGPDKQDDDTGRIKVDEVDALCLLVEEIHELFAPHRLTDFDTGIWQENKILVCPLLAHLKTMRQFTGIVRVTFRVDKAVT